VQGLCFIEAAEQYCSAGGASEAGGRHRAAGISSKPEQTMQKPPGNDLLNVRHLVMQESLQGASSSGMLMQGTNSKTCEGDGSV
jgi:hypothetical protein